MPVEKTLFREVLGNFAAGVTVVTTTGQDATPYGLTATAFTSVSLVPPLVLVCVDKGSESYPHFESSGIFAVNLLSQDQKALSQRFAVSGGDKFSGLDWHRGLLATPILAGTLGHLECRIRHVYDGGDHTIYVGEVEAAKGCEGDPLVYFRGKYRSVRDL